MPRPGRQYTALERAADKLEPNMVGATVRAFDRIRSRVDVNTLANMISAGKTRAAMRAAIPTAEEMDEIFKPLARVQDDAFKRGYRLGMDEVKKL